ncbi:MAG TPA: hypothetical protein VK369_06830 [Segetibacter sp.]|nr:hypothetical protein [Segetibacter sp.]
MSHRVLGRVKAVGEERLAKFKSSRAKFVHARQVMYARRIVFHHNKSQVHKKD